MSRMIIIQTWDSSECKDFQFNSLLQLNVTFGRLESSGSQRFPQKIQNQRSEKKVCPASSKLHEHMHNILIKVPEWNGGNKPLSEKKSKKHYRNK